MPQSLTNLLYHIIFSTKNREPLIHADLRPRLHDYLGGILLESGCKPVITNGVEDHVHVLAYLAAPMSMSDAVRILKSNSSRWVHQTFPADRSFAWQAGYAAFTVSRSVLEDVRRYVANQVDHHKTVTFQDEYRAFLKKHEITFDEKYVWD